ncbi:transketolase family protein [Butyrivibrio proteoclasticus]|uniref:transketolase family protein n=1 Tax=Butyrivibrio proteoclasticus TaxID=43305 RepID=UPI00047B089D|nr:transketolase C-terminal domain-containing protein [Butyrivibrio proteoclasticus]
MIEIKRNKVKLWSRLGARATFGQTILELAKERDDFFVTSADLAQSSGLVRFKEEFPERFVNAGIAEQNMIGIAAGLAKDGTNVFATSFSPFVTMRACEQVRMNMGYMQLNIKTVGLGSGLIMSQLGNSHYGIEDGSVMRAIPGMTVVNPADGVEIVKMVEALCDFEGPVYLRLTGGPGLPVVYEDDIDFQIGKAIRVKDGKDIAIIACGTMVYYSKIAADILEKKGISASVIDMHTIKPLDGVMVDSVLGSKLIVTVEEASTIGGLGSAVAEYISLKKNKPPQLMVGIKDCFPHAGSYQYLLEECELTGEQIAIKIEKALFDADY